ncbi:MAG: methyltransferase family protein [Solirubrobacterales bacterium]
MLEPELTASSTEASGVRVPPPLYYVAGILIGLALEAAFPIDRPSVAIMVAGTAIGIAGWLALDGAAMISFACARTSMVPVRPSSALVTTGPYRLTRNPMYAGMAFLYLAFSLALGLVWPLIVLPLMIAAVDRLVIATEEAYLLRRFGQPYRDYMTEVRRWL